MTDKQTHQSPDVQSEPQATLQGDTQSIRVSRETYARIDEIRQLLARRAVEGLKQEHIVPITIPAGEVVDMCLRAWLTHFRVAQAQIEMQAEMTSPAVKAASVPIPPASHPRKPAKR